MVTATSFADTKFCYDRDEANKILNCLDMKKDYEQGLAAQEAERSKQTFWTTIYGQVTLTLLGFTVGYTVSSLKR